MADFDVFQKAKKATEQAAARATELRDQAAAKAAEIKEQAAARGAELKETVTTRAADMKDSVAATATGVKDSVAATATGVKDSVTATATGMKESVAATATGVKESVAATAAEVKDAGNARIREAIEEFNAAVPVIRQAGYNVGDVTITIGLPPKIVASFTSSDDVTEEAVNRAIEENADKKFTVMLVRSLFQAWRLQSSLQVVGMKPRGISVEIGLTPNVAIKFA